MDLHTNSLFCYFYRNIILILLIVNIIIKEEILLSYRFKIMQKFFEFLSAKYKESGRLSQMGDIFNIVLNFALFSLLNGRCMSPYRAFLKKMCFYVISTIIKIRNDFCISYIIVLM